MTPSYPERKETIIVVHVINSSRHHFDRLIPAAMLTQSGFNVLLILITSAPGSATVHRSGI